MVHPVSLLLLLLATPSADLAAGRAALRAHDAAAAREVLERCVAAAPGSVECWWELGWAHWLEREWEATVQAWERVRALDPKHPDLARYLKEARAQQALRASLEAETARAPHAPKPAAGASARAVAPASGGDVLRVRAVGDVMLGTSLPPGFLPPEDGRRMLAAVEDLLRDADLTFANLEGPLCDEGETRKCRPGQNCYAFRSPTRYGRYLKEAGIDVVSTANNHNGDFGEPCRRATEATLDALGIAWSGRPGSVAHLEAGGRSVALIAFHTSPATNDVNDLETAKALVRRAAATSDLVIVSFHGGAEGRRALHVPQGKEIFYGENRGALRRFAHGVVDAGADLVLGHGPHVPRGMEVYRGRLIAYSLGNFATYGRFNLSGPLALGLVLEVELGPDGRFAGGRIFSTVQRGKGVPEPDPRGDAAALVRRLSREDFRGRAVQVTRDGRLLPPASQAAEGAGP